MTAKSLAPLSGVVAVGLTITAFAVGGETPDIDAPLNEITSFYGENDSSQMASGALLAYGALFLLIFSSTVAAVLRRAQGENGGPAALAFAGGIILSLGFLLFAGISFTLGDASDKLDPAALQALNALNADLFFPLAVGNAAFLLGSGVAVLRTGGLPKWLGWLAVVVGVVAATPIGFFAIPALGVWILIASVLLSRSAEPRSAGSAGGPPAAPGAVGTLS